MTTAGREEGQWLDGLAHHVGLDTDAAHVADTIVSTVRDIETVLRPVIGPTGFDALGSVGLSPLVLCGVAAQDTLQ